MQHQENGFMREFSEHEVKMIKGLIEKPVSEDEFQLFLYQCQRSGLDPLARQIYPVVRWDSDKGKNRLSTQTSIDGFRLVAERTQKYAGQMGPFWCSDDGIWKDVWLLKTPPVACKVGVLRHDFKEPCWGVARFDAYAQTKKGGGLSMMWEKMPDVMSAKCAEALALRKAFPQELSGLYTGDEMAQADNPKTENQVKDEENIVKIFGGSMRDVDDESRQMFYDQALKDLNACMDMQKLKEIWGKIYKGRKVFTDEQYADLELLKEQMKIEIENKPPF